MTGDKLSGFKILEVGSVGNGGMGGNKYVDNLLKVNM